MLTLQSIQWGPIIAVLLTASIGVAGYFIRTVSKTLAEHSTALAVLVAETRPGLKLQDEVLDLKLASAELNESRKNHEQRLTSLENSREKYH